MTAPAPLVILHLGLGAFHRAHQAVYLHRLHQLGDTRWVLAGANLRPDNADVIAALQAQGGAFTLETISPQDERRYERITAIQRVIPYEPTLAQVIALGADAGTRIVSFTVTEAGYYLDPAGRLDATMPDLAADLALARRGLPGSTLYGALAALLRERARRDSGPLTLMNCDNLRSNGRRARAGLLAFLAEAGDTELRDWVERRTCWPDAMVDRITPRPTPEVRDRVRAATGEDDAAPVSAESFIQWVIGDDFCNGRPEWERVGVQMVRDVEPYEEAKIRILNATHSCIAWAGTLKGLRYIHEGTRDAAIRQMAHAYVTHDVIPCLDRPEHRSQIDLAAYRDTVLDRFGNAAIADTNQRVAADGFSKIPGFIAPTVRERLSRGESIAHVAVLPALFLAFLERWHRGELPYDYQDQAMDPAEAHALCSAADPVKALAANVVLWGPLAGQPALQQALTLARAEVRTLLGA